MKKITSFLFLFLLINFCWSQNNKVSIIYGVNLAPNCHSPEGDKIFDYISFVKTETEIQKSQNEFYHLEQNYLAGIKYGLDNVELYQNYFNQFRLKGESFLFVGKKDKKQPYLELKKDTLFFFMEQLIVQKSLYKDKIITTDQIFEYDEWGDEFYLEKVEFRNIYEMAFSIRFSEEWAINFSGNFSKTIQAYQLAYPHLDETDKQHGIMLPVVLVDNTLKNENLFKTVEYDVVFSSSNTEQVEEYIQKGYFHNIYPNDKKKLLKPIMVGILSGSMDMYYPDKYDEKGNPIKVKQDSSKVNLTSFKESIIIEDEWGEPIEAEVVYQYSSEDIIGFRFLEDWYVDEKANSFKKKVKYYAPMIYVRNEMGEVMGSKILFWIKN